MYRKEELIQRLRDRKILIAGYGREGKSTHQLIQQLVPEADVTIVEGNDNIKLEAAKGYDLIIKSPGIPTFVFEGCCNLNTITQQTDLFLQVYGDRVIGITGTKGKSTTTNLVYAMMKRKFENVVMAGNMGIPLFDIINELDEASWIVCEFSCHQLENIQKGPYIGAVLNLFQEHLDHYHNYMEYKMAKMQIGLQQNQESHFFYCDDNAELKALVSQHAFKSHLHNYNLNQAQTHVGVWPRLLQGNHNLSNIELVRQIGSVMGIDEGLIREVVANFKGLEHRLELVGTYHGITFYNDSISTIPAACIEAVKSLSTVQTLILGGFDRGIDYEPLVNFLPTSGVENIVFVGEAGKRIKELLTSRYTPKNQLTTNNYKEIVDWCYQVTENGKTCLLSPAAASYDQFKNFEERGRTFKDLVQK